VKWEGTKWVVDTLDGGAGRWLREVVDADGKIREVKRWELADWQSGVLPVDWTDAKFQGPNRASGAGAGKEDEERLHAQCHCGGVKFYITRPNKASREVRSPWPDLIVPYHTGASSANPENVTWWLRDDDTKYLAGTCTCTSCRKGLGFEIQTWAFIPKCNIFQEDGRPLDFSIGSLKRYESSKDISREFCGVCGASVFWHCEERPDLIDVSAGLLDPAEGARVEGWLDWWTERVSFEEMAVSTGLVRGLEAGLRDWAAEKR